MLLAIGDAVGSAEFEGSDVESAVDGAAVGDEEAVSGFLIVVVGEDDVGFEETPGSGGTGGIGGDRSRPVDALLAEVLASSVASGAPREWPMI